MHYVVDDIERIDIPLCFRKLRGIKLMLENKAREWEIENVDGTFWPVHFDIDTGHIVSNSAPTVCVSFSHKNKSGHVDNFTLTANLDYDYICCEEDDEIMYAMIENDECPYAIEMTRNDDELVLSDEEYPSFTWDELLENIPKWLDAKVKEYLIEPD